MKSPRWPAGRRKKPDGGQDFGAPVVVEAFVRFQVGEGMEKVEADFADEVAQMAGTR